MPIREYAAVDPGKSCRHCGNGFEEVEAIDAPPKKTCPRCGSKITRQLSAPRVGSSESGLHDRAKSAGFTTYEKLGKGEYEKKY
ncbi:FmdB family zinc ribbon protein [Pontiella agarivorans]|uniref:Zinc ribbon domain-containing protein n=1 Tax=Pontiella agarivorans TaxID=3038953 RepID=A0ABU5MTX9_9BACT|nr:zinc ribbon domain-containing protein [Pontiella agarivorans]MDZ8117583.1 zinc ribbon domain-containing protein [Pontiella agarivorans]